MAYRRDAPGEAVEGPSPRSPLRVAGLDADQGRDHLQVVFDTMLYLKQLRVFFSNPLRKLFMGGIMMRTNVHQRDESKDRDAVVILDDIRVNINNGRLALSAFNSERPDTVARFHDGRAQGALCVIPAVQDAPGLPFDLSGRLP